MDEWIKTYPVGIAIPEGFQGFDLLFIQLHTDRQTHTQSHTHTHTHT